MEKLERQILGCRIEHNRKIKDVKTETQVTICSRVANRVKTGNLSGCTGNCLRDGFAFANQRRRVPFEARTIRQQYVQIPTYNSKQIADVGCVPGAQHTCHHERFAPRRKAAAVAAYFVNSHFWGAGRCPGRHPYYHRAGARPGELGCGPRKESDDDLRHAWPRRSFLWRQYSSGAISRRPFRRAAGSDSDYAPTSIARVSGYLLESALSRPDFQPDSNRRRVDWKHH